MKKPKFPGEFVRKANAKKHKVHHADLQMKPQQMPNSVDKMAGQFKHYSSPQEFRSQFKTPASFRTTPAALPKFKKHKKNWIAKAIKKPGALHRQLGVKAGRKIPAKTLARAAGKGGKLGRRARLAETLKRLNK